MDYLLYVAKQSAYQMIRQHLCPLKDSMNFLLLFTFNRHDGYKKKEKIEGKIKSGCGQILS